MNDEAKQWVHLHEQMSQGKVDYNPNFYVTSQEGHGDIQLVSPTQAQVDQAKMQIKRKLSVARKPAAKRRKKSQVGGRKAKPKAKAKSQRGGKRSKKVVKKRHVGKKRKPMKSRKY